MRCADGEQGLEIADFIPGVLFLSHRRKEVSQFLINTVQLVKEKKLPFDISMNYNSLN